jgi:hypothetical protein
VAVILPTTSSSSPASYSLWFEKYGLRFNPDLVLLFLNPFNMTHLEPTLLNKLIGWDPQHSPYRMYDVGPDGRLVTHPPDPAYGAFAKKPDPTPVMGEVPLAATQFVAEKSHPLVDRGFDLLRAILREQYKAPLNGRGKVGLIYGYDHTLPPYGTMYGADAVVGERWFSRVENLCAEEDLVAINLRRHVPPATEFKARMFWEYDNHLNASASYRMAAGMADEISRLPYFQELVKRYKNGPAGPAGGH